MTGKRPDASTARSSRRCPPLLALLDVPVDDAALAGPRSRPAPPADARRGQAPAAAGEPGAAAAGGLRGPALDRRRDPGPARQPGREPAHGPRSCSSSTTAPSTSTRWGRKTYYTQLRLDPLPARERRRAARALLGRRSGARAPQAAAGRAAGNPFFLEESVRTLVETEALAGERGAYRLTRPSRRSRSRPPCRPSWPRASTACRPRTSGCSRPPRSSARTCPSRCSWPSRRRPEDAVRRGLAHLQAAEFLYETRLFPDLEYTFKHALTHEVAYGSLLQEPAQPCTPGSSRPSSASIPTGWPSTSSGWPTTPCGGSCGRRRPRTSARRAPRPLARSANREAVAYFEQALAALAASPRDPRDARAGHRPSLRPPERAPPARRVRTDLRAISAKPKASPGRSTISSDSAGCPSICATTSG